MHLLDGLVHELEVIVVEHDPVSVLEGLFDRDRAIVGLVIACIQFARFQKMISPLNDHRIHMFSFIFISTILRDVDRGVANVHPLEVQQQVA